MLTSLSVVDVPAAETVLWVTFPEAGGVRRHPVRQVRTDGGLAVLELVSPAPREASPAPLRRARGDDLIGERWQASGARAYGVIAAPLPGGRVRLESGSPTAVPSDSAGAGVWSVRFQAIVGVIDGDSQAHTLEGIGRHAGSSPPPQPAESVPALYRIAWIAGARRPERVPSAGGAVVVVGRLTIDDRILVASAAADGTVALADPATGQAWRTLQTDPGQVRALVPLDLPDATCLGIVVADGSMTAWAPGHGWGQTFTVHSGRATTATCVPADLLAVGGEDGTVELRAPAESRPRWTASTGTGPVTALCALPDMLATAGADGQILVRDIASGELHRTLPLTRVTALAPVPDGDRTLLAAAGVDGTVTLWDPYAGKLHDRLAGHTAAVTALCPVPGGRLASVGADRTARLWNPATGATELVIPLHHEATACVAADGRLIVGLSAGTVAYDLPASSPAPAPSPSA